MKMSYSGIPEIFFRIPELKNKTYQISSCKISSFTSFTALIYENKIIHETFQNNRTRTNEDSQIQRLVPDGIQSPWFHGRILKFLPVARNPYGTVRIAHAYDI
jgi:hypothetical protein